MVPPRRERPVGTPRFVAVIDLDGAPHDPDPKPFHQPVLALTHPVDPADNPTYIPRLTQVLSLSSATTYRLTVPGSAHLTFTDAPLFLPPVPVLVGSLGRTRGPQVTIATTVAFLDATMRGKPGDLAAELRRTGPHGSPGTRTVRPVPDVEHVLHLLSTGWNAVERPSVAGSLRCEDDVWAGWESRSGWLGRPAPMRR